MKNNIYAAIMAATMSVATPALAAEYKVGDPMPKYAENGNWVYTQGPWTGSSEGGNCKGFVQQYADKDRTKLVFITNYVGDKAEGKLFAVFDVGTKTLYLDTKKADGSLGQDGTIDEVVKERANFLRGHPHCSKPKQ